ncbi:MAG: hypothetical protein B6U86_03725 [Candidatus Altiarchaeales archaeon ex4484_43]|nr:MAG: hypothetical protein B6U86_03725 [Candidatus Altiarchaeales archaeon ex4484_43]RLI89836.1 MAG: DUF424 domain-containing protein [Candidatus Altiarchaeales archaeon]
MIYVNVRKSQNEILVAACDEEILGESFSEGDVHLKVSKGFYRGDLVPIKELSGLLSNATIANLTGNRVVEEAIDLGFVEREHVMEVSGVKHAQLVVL